MIQVSKEALSWDLQILMYCILQEIKMYRLFIKEKIG